MRATSCILFGVAAAIFGACLRLAVPVTPVTEEFREVVRFHQSIGRP
ncbi:MAG: hypothetical protein K2Y56_08225 [Methylobacterium sp.]|nr:hypothetical protein [Methylobacterium sp.]MBX9931512.1 hypothetical protein [Methylobacterium sp.]